MIWRGRVEWKSAKCKSPGRGIAKALVNAACAALKKLGITKVALVVFERNVVGNAFWKKLGFYARTDLVYRDKALVEIGGLILDGVSPCNISKKRVE